MPILYWPNIDNLKFKSYVREQPSFGLTVPLQDWSQSLNCLYRPYKICNDPVIMTTFLWADYHTHGLYKSTHLDSCSAIGLVNEGNAIWAYSVITFLWADRHTSRFSYLHCLSDAVHNSAKQQSSCGPAIVRVNYIRK